MFLGDKMKSQMLKGVIEGVILKIIKDKETYGYEIVETLRLNGFYNMTESTVYPILQRLSKKGLIFFSTIFFPILSIYSISKSDFSTSISSSSSIKYKNILSTFLLLYTNKL